MRNVYEAMMERTLVCGGGEFIGYQIVSKLRKEGFWVCGVSFKGCEFCEVKANEFIKCV